MLAAQLPMLYVARPANSARSGEVDSHIVATVTFVQPDGARETVSGKRGETVMDFAVDNGVAGIDGQCGGGCTCTTCHCYLLDPWFEMSGELDPDEREILEFVPEARANSRLGCQVVVTAAMDGMVVEVPQPSDADTSD